MSEIRLLSDETENYKENYDIYMLGDWKVGKTSLMSRYKLHYYSYNGNMFMQIHFQTTGMDFITKNYQINDRKFTVKIWDTAGQERFRCITKSSCKRADGIIFVYDISVVESFNLLKTWISSIHDEYPDKPKMLVGNKIDLPKEDTIPSKTGKDFADEYSMLFCETSAKLDTNVTPMFESIIEKIVTKSKEIIKSSFKINNQHRETKSCC